MLRSNKMCIRDRLLAVPLLSNPAFGKDQREINALLKEAEDAHIENVLMTVNLNEPYNQYQWSIIPMMDRDLVMVIGEQNLERKVTVAYNFKNAEVKAAVLKTTVWGAEQCAGLGDLFYHLYVDESVIPEALNNVNLALGDHLATLSYCTVFEPLGPVSLSYGSNSDQLVAQFTKIGGTDSGQPVSYTHLEQSSGRAQFPRLILSIKDPSQVESVMELLRFQFPNWILPDE